MMFLIKPFVTEIAFSSLEMMKIDTSKCFEVNQTGMQRVTVLPSYYLDKILAKKHRFK